ncbi:longevity-assurance protein-like protein [Byssothecium circinans]|uniref:Longevity-assurance protein-like protein n=1 Tax=Byssothecium circinans TaxID=147558 RepID=A0A6A5TNX9_9PLEO|nr:longevity-assurance protein-like protein [Byssothecium circinans]
MATKISTPCRGSHAAPVANGAEFPDTHTNGAAGAQKAKRKTKTKPAEDSLLGYLCAQVCDHQFGISVNLLLLLFLTHIFFPRARRRTSRFFRLSYYNPETEKYGCGTDDLYYVVLCLVTFTGLRVAVMEYVLDHLARRSGIKTKKGLERFKEQAWLICYCVCSWSLGMYIIYNSNYWFNLHNLWIGWPYREITGLSKLYYLIQWGFWLQQLLVVNIEEKRKDYWEMFTHHIFTSALLFLSYGMYHTRVGTVILCIMDLVDIVLPTAKLLKYTGYSNACDVFFGLFVITWLITRHVFYPLVCWSIYKHSPTDMAPGCYFPNGAFIPASQTAEYEALGGNSLWPNLISAYTNRDGAVCWNPSNRYSFLTLLLALQAIILLWFVMIVKVVYKVVRGQNADDVRSDDEDEGEEVDEDAMERERVSGPINSVKGGAEWMGPGTPMEQEVGVEALSFSKRRERAAHQRSSAARASGISIPGHGDRKELLGRIGCDKPA